MNSPHPLFAPAGPPIHPASRGARPYAVRVLAMALLLQLALAFVPAPPVHAQTVRAWMPPDTDSLTIWAAEAKTRFRANQGDSTGGRNYRAYEIVGDMGRRLMGSLGRDGMVQGHAVEMMLDSLGLDTDVRVDPRHPTFAILMVRNPYRLSASAVGFLLWWKVRDLRMQAIEFHGGLDPQGRVWWTGREDSPWEWGITDLDRNHDQVGFMLLNLVPSGTYWRIAQFDPQGIPSRAVSSVVWADLNGDDRPELLVFVRADADSTVIPCKECPRAFTQLTFVERPQGFMLMDTRLVPSPLSTFTRFVQLLGEGDRAGAGRLLKDPRRIDEAIALGWSGLKAPGSWRILYAEPNTAWPQWLMVRVKGLRRTHDYQVVFDTAYGRWVVSDWQLRDDATTPGFLPPDSTHAARPKAPVHRGSSPRR